MMQSRHFGMLIAILSLTIATPAAAKNEKSWATASDIGAYGLTAVALGIPIIEKDKHGALQAAGSIVASELVARGLKEAFPELRPDGSDRKSFPSAHTSLAFAAASTLYNRQGGKVGIPAFAVAAFVGLARVQADKHHWYDCVAGAGVGLASGFLITRKANQRVAVVPWGDSKGGGFSLAARF